MAGVFGMARTIAALPRCFSRKPSVLPAATETTTVSGPTALFTAGSTVSITCGLTARNSTPAFSFAGRTVRCVAPASPIVASIAGDGPGSTTTTAEPGTPLFSQPESIAPPMFPAPIRTTGFFEEKAFAGIYASPTVSNSTASIAFVASMPDQTTNWKDWK